ncbi:MAG: hypothetical protein JXQ75_01880 [Phycisphaerae bacterium]|nr:hypothetical protein [Phycisphaerae bacterium]
MLVQHRMSLTFATSHVQEPFTWEMTLRFKNLMFNLNTLNVGVHEADMQLSLIGEPADVKRAKQYLKEQGVTLKTLSSHRYKGKFPDVPENPPRRRPDAKMIERKLWLTLIGTQRDQPHLWLLARQYDVGYKITHSATGEGMAIISLLVWGPEEEVEKVVCYLRGAGINVEYGEVGVSAPFTPVD